MLKGYVELTYIVEQQIKHILSLVVLSFSFGRIAQLVAHSPHKQKVPGSSPGHGT